MVHLNGVMVVNIWVNGRTENNMEKGQLQIKKERKQQMNGKMEKKKIEYYIFNDYETNFNSVNYDLEIA